MKLSQWAKEQGIHYQTAWQWFKDGKIDGAYKSKSGSIFVENDESELKIQLLTYALQVEQMKNREELLRQQLAEYQFQLNNKKG
jgi:putative resolvase